MGFGHRVYKNFDPRARIIKKAADEVLGQLGVNDPVLDIAKQLEEVALNDDYFVQRGLYPNVDFTAASSTAPWAFPPTCSPSCSLWDVCQDGLASGKR